MEHILSILIFFPAIAGVLGFLINRDGIRIYAITITMLEFLISLVLWFQFDSSQIGIQFVENIPLIPEFGVGYFLGLDGISLFLVVLTTFMTMIGIVSIPENTKDMRELLLTLLFLETTMVGVFVALDAILFYIFWELSLVPMLYIIGHWGGEKRIYASIKFFLYTFAGSLIMLIGMLVMAYLYFQATGIWSFNLLEWYRLQLPVDYQLWLFGAFFLGFAIKVPMFPFHTWLPYAHGQAPTVGSVILAAILLKMGTYGFIRFSLPLYPDASVYFITPVAILSIIMIIYTAMVAYAQKDIKQLVAYSSISHMGVVMLGIFALNPEGITGSIFLMISHGIVSGALFLLVGVIYERKHTKMMSEFGGLASVMPRYALIFGIMMMASVGLPLTIGFVGEFLSFVGFYKISHVMTILGGTAVIVGAIYMLGAYKKTFFGQVTKEENRKLSDLNFREYATLIPLTLLVIFLGVYPKPVLEPVDKSVKAVVSIMHQKAITEEGKNTIPLIDLSKEIK
ncbi:MAG TPA: NADH-quinone oxidoreductase subunit M [Campylobacterales bacterium]|nr:NADH-quinone oxidoreductase subunit M [Campylobacterales bacterium]